jgi:hypothetical protein
MIRLWNLSLLTEDETCGEEGRYDGQHDLEELA